MNKDKKTTKTQGKRGKNKQKEMIGINGYNVFYKGEFRKILGSGNIEEQNINLMDYASDRLEMSDLQRVGITNLLNNDNNNECYIDGYSIDDVKEESEGRITLILCDRERDGNLTLEDVRNSMKCIESFHKKILRTGNLSGDFSRLKTFLNKKGNIIHYIFLSPRYCRSLDKDLLKDGVFYKYYAGQHFYEWALQNKNEGKFANIEFKGNGIKCVKIIGSDPKSYIFAIPGIALAKSYAKYPRILESNVRQFLGEKTNTNRAILKTLDSNPSRFFSYNNGLSMTAESIDFNKGETCIKKLNGVQIVNGGQTTAQLYNYWSKNKGNEKLKKLEKVSVLVKLSVISEGTEDLVTNIAIASNSQNKVSSSDFVSNKWYSKIIEKLSRKILRIDDNNRDRTYGWYYERMRGQYDSECRRIADRKTKFPPEYKFNKEILASALLLFDDRPYLSAFQPAEVVRRVFLKSNEASPDDDERFLYWKYCGPIINLNAMWFTKLVGKVALINISKSVVDKMRSSGKLKAAGDRNISVVDAETLSRLTLGAITVALRTKDKMFDFVYIWQECSKSRNFSFFDSDFKKIIEKYAIIIFKLFGSPYPEDLRRELRNAERRRDNNENKWWSKIRGRILEIKDEVLDENWGQLIYDIKSDNKRNIINAKAYSDTVRSAIQRYPYWNAFKENCRTEEGFKYGTRQYIDTIERIQRNLSIEEEQLYRLYSYLMINDYPIHDYL